MSFRALKGRFFGRGVLDDNVFGGSIFTGTVAVEG
jgi:hypothetical protein